ncbi:hypothetical protein [Trueperella bialowiezensis]|uniref:Uncharacterized protein n=1 Tax=Trueperella bialowiezensis TaxID=312285 RepID=A0A448PGW1_9ACTO|nr:hypothetical protein [Trueperella bialowiezensis]VEI14134.1 Uncharacterised protein [Trueperella bialowiezensis]
MAQALGVDRRYRRAGLLCVATLIAALCGCGESASDPSEPSEDAFTLLVTPNIDADVYLVGIETYANGDVVSITAESNANLSVFDPPATFEFIDDENLTKLENAEATVQVYVATSKVQAEESNARMDFTGLHKVGQQVPITVVRGQTQSLTVP